MIILIECIVLIAAFTGMVMLITRDPIETLYNYPPKVQEKVRSMKEYEGKIPTQEKKLGTKAAAVLVIIAAVSLLLRYVNGCESFLEAFKTSLLLWTVVNVYDVVVLDICWFCRAERFVFKGTEDIRDEYRNYGFHIKEGVKGEFIGIAVCALISLVVEFVL